jgi:hypothetical protein
MQQFTQLLHTTLAVCHCFQVIGAVCHSPMLQAAAAADMCKELVRTRELRARVIGVITTKGAVQ